MTHVRIYSKCIILNYTLFCNWGGGGGGGGGLLGMSPISSKFTFPVIDFEAI